MMSATVSAPPAYTGWSVIVHSTLVGSQIGHILRQKGIKVRGSDFVIEGSVIFPKPKVGFTVLDLTQQLLVQYKRADDTPTGSQSQETTRVDSDLSGVASACTKEFGENRLRKRNDSYNEVLSRLDKFTSLHGHCYILLVAPLFTETELSFLYHLQNRYMEKTSMDILTAHSAEDCVNGMLTISELQTPPKSDVLHQRFCRLITELVQPLPQGNLSDTQGAVQH